MSAVSSVQLVANQANAQLSRGPVTEQGKRRSSMNALRHGLTGRVVVLPAEDLNQYQALSQKLLAELRPKGALEEQLAQNAIDAQWRLNRIRSIEDGLLVGAGSPLAVDHPEIDVALSTAQAFKDNGQALNNLSIYEQRIHRIFERNLALLEKAQAERIARNQFLFDQAILLHQAAKKEGKSFNPQENGFDFSSEFLEAECALGDRLKEAQCTVNGLQNPGRRVLKA